MISVGVIDDHPVAIEGLAAALNRVPDIAVVWTAAGVEEAGARLGGRTCDVVVLDVTVSDGSCLELLEDGDGRPAFVIFSSLDRRQYARAAFARGAAAYVLKTAPLSELVAAVRLAAAGRVAFTPSLLLTLSAPPELSARELTVVRLVAAGLSNDEVGARLSVSAKTVEAHLSRLYARLHVSNRTELALRVERDGWLDLPFGARQHGGPALDADSAS